jgi:dienelactone hydrolase
LPALLAESDYTPVGTVTEVAGAQLYTVGSDKSKALVIITDIFGSDSGRHKAIADSFAERGFTVVLVDGTVGKPIDPNDNIGEKIGPFALSHRWAEELAPVFTQAVLPHLKSLGFDKFATLGFCYGVWVQFKALNDAAVAPHIVAQVCPHPSIQLEGFHGGKGPELAGKIACPTLLLPARNDPDFVQSGGAVESDLRARGVVCETHVFDQPHGFFVRGDVKSDAVRADVDKAFQLSLEFLQKHM